MTHHTGSAEGRGPLAPYYTAANEKAREIVTLIKTAEAYDADPDGHEIRGQILDEWSAAVIAALADPTDGATT